MPLPIGMPNSSCTLDDPGRRFVGDDLEMVGLAADHGAQRDQRIEVAGLREPLQRQRRFERARNGDHGDVAVGDTGVREAAQCTGEQGVADRRVEARQHDADATAVAVDVGRNALDGHGAGLSVFGQSVRGVGRPD